MTQVVIDDVLPYTQAVAILNQTVFMTNWTANAASDVVVYVTPPATAPNDATQILPYPSGYSVAFIGDQQEVQVTLVTPSVAGAIVTITRQTPADRLNLYSNTNFVPSMLNNDFGILTLVDQQAQLVDQKVGPRYNYSAVIVQIVDTILPVLKANETWVKNNSNTAITTVTLPASGAAPADASYILMTSDSSALPNSFGLDSLGTGLLVNVPGSSLLSVTTVAGTNNQIGVVGGDGTGGNITISIIPNPLIPGTAGMGIPAGTTAQRVTPTPPSVGFRYNSTLDSLEFFSNGTWSQVSDNTDGIVLPGLINQLGYYATTGNTISGLATANGAVLVTDNSGVPIMLSGSADTGRYLQSVQNGEPIFSAITWPTDVSTYQLLYAGSNHVVNALNPSLSSVLCSTQTGAPDWVGPLTNGQIIIGSTGLLPVAASLTAGSGVSITTGAGSITISATGSGGTVTQVNTGTGLSGGPITTTGTISLDIPVTIAHGGTGVTSTPTSASASNFSAWDASVNLPANNFLEAYATTATAAGTTTLTVASSGQQFFTGSTTQTVVMPVTSTLTIGQQYRIVNTSSGSLTINSSGGNNILTAGANTVSILTCILTSGTTASSWHFTLVDQNEGGGVTSVATGTGLTGGPITTTGTLSFAAIGAHKLWANVTGSSAVPTEVSTSTFIQQVVTQVITSTGTYTPTTGMQYCTVEISGGGGGGGGAASSGAGNASAGGGGGSGGYCKKTYTAALIGANAAVVIGAAGAAGASGTNNGGAGGNSTFTPAGAGAVLTANGGSGGTGGTSSASINASPGGSGGSATNGDINIYGTGGSQGWALAAGALASAGMGADSFLGKAWGGQTGASNGTGLETNPGNYGAGGGGGQSITANRAGGAGIVGVCYITEYISI